MKIGVKTYYNEDFLRKLKDKVDFFEIVAIEGKEYSFLNSLSKPVVVHAQHERFGINLSDKKNLQKKINSINFAIKIADLCKSEKIIIHSGNIQSSSCSTDESIRFIKSIKDRRILLENLPQWENYLCNTPKEVSNFMEKTGAGFCFDINHAIQTAYVCEIDPYKFCNEFIKLKPNHYHLGGQKNGKENETHLNFKDSEINLKKIFKMLPKNAEITLETTTNSEEVEKDLEIIRRTIEILKR